MRRGDLEKFMAGLRRVESDGDYTVVNSIGAAGAYQVMPGTWNGYAGYRSAADAPREVQDRFAAALLTRYHHRYRDWRLVAAAWHAGPGNADRARRDYSYLSRINDGNITTARYVRRVLAAAGLPQSGRPRAPGGTAQLFSEIRPWRFPKGGRSRLVRVDTDELRRLAARLTDYLSVTESAYHRCRAARDGIVTSRLEVGDEPAADRLQHTLRRALDDWDGLRRLPQLLSNDIGYVIEARARTLAADVPARSRSERWETLRRRGISGLARSLDARSRRTRAHVAELLRQIYGRDDRSRHLALHLPTPPPRHRSPGSHGRRNSDGAGHPARALRDVDVGRAWGGAKSVFDQFVTPFLRRRGLEPNHGHIKWNNPNLASDHRPERRDSYAIDYPTHQGLDDARALARALGIEGWRPNAYQSFTVGVDGVRFRVQILWGSGIDHGDHVHVGFRRL